MTTRIELLDYAENVLDGTIPLGARSARTAALLGRCAFEQWLDEQSGTWSTAVVREPTANSKLVVLTTQRGEELGERARRAWNGLSRACHHHAYELRPSSAEVGHLLNVVRELDGNT